LKFWSVLHKKSNSVEQTGEQQPEGSDSNKPVRSLSGYLCLIILLGIFLIGGLWMLVRYQINVDYDRTIEAASQETTNLAIAFEEHVRRIIADTDKDLLSQKQAYEQDGVSSPVISEEMKNTVKDPSRVQVAIFNAQGTLVASFTKLAPTVNASDRDYFQIHRSSAPETLFIGKPIITKTQGRTVIPVSRRINHSDGSFAGVIYIGLNPDYFSSFYNKMNLGQDQRITLIGMDWIVRARQSGDNLEVGQDVYGAPLWKNVQGGHTQGTYLSKDVLDGIPRIVSYRVMPDYPFVVSVGKATHVALADFEKRKRSYILGASLASLFILAFCGLLVNQLRQIVRKGERRYESLLASMSNAFSFGRVIYENGKAEDFIHLAVNDAFMNLTGRKDAVGKKITEILPGIKETNPELLEVCGRVARTGRSERFEMHIKPVNLWLENAISSDQEGYFMAIFNDITERKVMEAELEKHRDKLQDLVTERTQELAKANIKLAEQAQLLDSAHDYITIRDMDNRILYWNLGAEVGYGWNRSEALGQKLGKLLRSELPQTQEEVVDTLIRQGFWEGELTDYSKDGRRITVKSHQTLNRDAGGTPVSILEIGHDISAQKQSEELFAKVFHTNPNMMSITEMEGGRYLDVNESFARNLGRSRDEIIGLSYDDISLSPDQVEIEKLKTEFSRGGRLESYPTTYRTRTGELRSALLSTDIITIRDRQCLLTVLTDTTEQKKFEAELSRLDRLNTVGEMAASIGHEIRNPLTTVRGYLQHYGRKASFAEYRESFALMIDELDRANSIITEFLSLAKNKAVVLKPTHLNQVIGSLAPLIQADALRRGSDIELALGEIPEVLADDKEMRQCILNLVSNGLDAMPKGGKITIGTAKVGNCVILTVQDRGFGIPPEIKKKLGTPFLTTKENGVGLGLAVCYRIAQRHQAIIEVETGPEGSAIRFIFSLKEKNE
jgi:PAS domain S-box-containing protein